MKRIELKQEARETLRKHRKMAILGIILPSLAGVFIIGLLTGIVVMTEQFAIILLLVLIGFAFVPITVGINYFYRQLLNVGNQTTFDDLLKGHKSHFFRNLGRLLQMQIFIDLWMLLLFIPGIVKSLSYAMTPYILGDDDIKKGASQPNPITISRLMMDGHKMELFVLILSFIGWILLGALTLNVLTIVFVGPYIQLTMAEFYEKLKKDLDPKYLTSGN